MVFSSPRGERFDHLLVVFDETTGFPFLVFIDEKSKCPYKETKNAPETNDDIFFKQSREVSQLMGRFEERLQTNPAEQNTLAEAISQKNYVFVYFADHYASTFVLGDATMGTIVMGRNKLQIFLGQMWPIYQAIRVSLRSKTVIADGTEEDTLFPTHTSNIQNTST